ncbi:MAG: FAD-binding protein [Chloroflexia bacterium]
MPIKQVPESEELRYDPSTRTLVREGVTSVINAYDKRALTEAIRLRELYGGAITALTMGPPQARQALIECLGRGVDRCIHITDRAFAGSDTLATARTLAAVLRRLTYDLLLLGKMSTDSETGQVGPELAELLDLPQITGATTIELAENNTLHVTRETDFGFEQIECPLPALLTAAEHLIKPAKTRPEVIEKGQQLISSDPTLIETLSAHDLNLQPAEAGLSGSPTWVTELRPVVIDRARIMLSGDSLSSAKSLLAELERREVGTVKSGHASQLPASPSVPDPNRAVWVVAETLPSPYGQPRLRRVSLELAGEAARIASLVGGEAVSLLIGNKVAPLVDELACYGTGSVYLADDKRLEPYNVEAYASILSRAIEQRKPWAVLLPATSFGQDLAPRVAARLGLGLTADCLGIEIDREGRLLQLKPAFGGQVVAPILSRTLPQMATIRPGMVDLYAPNLSIRPNITMLDLDGLPTGRARVVSTSGEGEAGLALDAARLVVCVGTGIGGPDALPQIYDLSRLLGARFGFSPDEIAIGATRKVIDAGWLPRHQQIGITGRAIAPDLYLGLGVHGTFNHTVGILRSGTVVSINNDPQAPIFAASDIGIVSNWQDFVEACSSLLSS